MTIRVFFQPGIREIKGGRETKNGILKITHILHVPAYGPKRTRLCFTDNAVSLVSRFGRVCFCRCSMRLHVRAGGYVRTVFQKISTVGALE